MSTRPKMLVLDDRRTLADASARLFESLGFETTAVYTGNDFVRALSDDLDVIISDLEIGENRTGVDLLKLAAERAPKALRILNSGAACPAEFEISPGRQVFIQKPFGRQEFVEITRQIGKDEVRNTQEASTRE